VANDDRPHLGVEVAAVKRDRVPDPHPGDQQQTEQRPKRRGLVLGA